MGGALNRSGERFQNNAASCPDSLVSCGRNADSCKKTSMRQQKYPDRVDVGSGTTDAEIENMTLAS